MAESTLLSRLRSEPEFVAVPANERMEDAQVFFERIEEAPAEEARTPGKGFTFFRMKD